MRTPIIAGNWKMNKTPSEAHAFAKEILRELAPLDLKGLTGLGDENAVDVVLCPAYPALSKVNDVIAGSHIKLGAQDLFWEKSCAYTGEVSAPMLKDAGCQYVIVGHSERRQYFGETDDSVNKKVKAALANGLIPIACVGETLKERQWGKTFDVVKTQLTGGLSEIPADDAVKIVIAYEPIWAIGTGVNAAPQQAQEVHRFIREVLGQLFGGTAAEKMRIQYGGSVRPDNVSGLMAQKDIDGALVGGASLEVKSFAGIVKGAKR